MSLTPEQRDTIQTLVRKSWRSDVDRVCANREYTAILIPLLAITPKRAHPDDAHFLHTLITIHAKQSTTHTEEHAEKLVAEVDRILHTLA